jgi:hypothetical protein
MQILVTQLTSQTATVKTPNKFDMSYEMTKITAL